MPLEMRSVWEKCGGTLAERDVAYIGDLSKLRRARRGKVEDLR